MAFVTCTFNGNSSRHRSKIATKVDCSRMEENFIVHIRIEREYAGFIESCCMCRFHCNIVVPVYIRININNHNHNYIN